jgi:hypothetical protein
VEIELFDLRLVPFGTRQRSSTLKSNRSMDNRSVIYESVLPCPMFPLVSRLFVAFRSTTPDAISLLFVYPRQWAGLYT